MIYTVYSFLLVVSAHMSRLSTQDTSWVEAATAVAGLGLQKRPLTQPVHSEVVNPWKCHKMHGCVAGSGPQPFKFEN